MSVGAMGGCAFAAAAVVRGVNISEGRGGGWFEPFQATGEGVAYRRQHEQSDHQREKRRDEMGPVVGAGH